MTPNRSTILNRLATGEISADEAARLLSEGPSAPEAPVPPRAPTPPTAPLPPGAPTSPEASQSSAGSMAGRWLHVRVTELDTGKQKVNVNVPLAWVEAGLRLGARNKEEIADLDVATCLADLKAGASGRIVEVEDLGENKRVEVYVD